MTPRKISVHQVGPGPASRGGAADAMLVVKHRLTELGFDSEIFLDGSAASSPLPSRPLSELRPGTQDLLLIHHSSYQDHLEWLAGLRVRKFLVYHGITPPRYFAPDSREYHLSVRAYAQLATLRGVSEASIVLSNARAEELRRRGFSPVTTIPFAKDWTELRSVDPVTPGDLRPSFRILNVGVTAAYNRQRDLVGFIDQVRSIETVPVELTLIGRGPHDRRYRAAIEQDIQRLGLGERVALIDALSPNVFAGYCRTANAYLSLSESEEAIGPMRAAMALDLPVVAYAAPGIAERLGDSAVLIHSRDPPTILDALHRLHRDGPFRRGIVRRQRQLVERDRGDTERHALQQWLLGMGAYETRSRVARLIGWHSSTAGIRVNGMRRPAPAPVAANCTTLQPAMHYAVEIGAESCRGPTDGGRQIALALDRLPERTASLELIGDAAAASSAGAGDPPARAGRLVTIRCAPGAAPVGMLGDVRLVDLGEAEGAIDATAAGLMNLHLDGVLVGSRFAARAVRNSGVRLPIAVVGRGVEVTAGTPLIAAPSAPRGVVGPSAPCMFLHIGGSPARSGIEELLTAYCLGFTSADSVLLAINPPRDERAMVDFWMKRLAGGEFSPPVQIFAETLGAAGLERLYGRADAVVLPMPAAELEHAAAVMASRIPLIAVRFGGHLDYCNAENALLIDYELDAAAEDVSPPARVRISVPGLIAAMKAVYRDGRRPETPTARRARRGQRDAAGLRWQAVAAKIDEFVVSLDKRPAMNRKIRLAWLSTYNSRCGLATHSEHLLEHFDRDVFDITVIGNHQQPLRPDPANVVRLWPDRSGSLASVREFIRAFDVLFVNFHFSLMEIHDLAATLRAAQQAGIDTHVTLHKTIDTVIDGRTVSLGEIADVLRRCTRLIVHTEADIARLKTFGVVDNVVMIPPGVIDRSAPTSATVRSLLNLQQFHPIVGTFGFLLPPKGLQQLIHAFALVLRHYPDAMLLMLNAEYPGVAASAEERDRGLALIRELALADRVRLIGEFLETDEILLLLSACDLTVFTYQDSAESDSGAVRLGLAAGRPVATTPLPVFANLAGVVHQFSGRDAADIAEGIVTLLRDPGRCAGIVQRQRAWISRNSWAAQAARISNIIRGCFAESRAFELQSPVPTRLEPALPGAVASDPPSSAEALREMMELVAVPAGPATGSMPEASPQVSPRPAEAAGIGTPDWRARRAR